VSTWSVSSWSRIVRAQIRPPHSALPAPAAGRAGRSPPAGSRDPASALTGAAPSGKLRRVWQGALRRKGEPAGRPGVQTASSRPEEALGAAERLHQPHRDLAVRGFSGLEGPGSAAGWAEQWRRPPLAHPCLGFPIRPNAVPPGFADCLQLTREQPTSRGPDVCLRAI